MYFWEKAILIMFFLLVVVVAFDVFVPYVYSWNYYVISDSSGNIFYTKDFEFLSDVGIRFLDKDGCEISIYGDFTIIDSPSLKE